MDDFKYINGGTPKIGDKVIFKSAGLQPELLNKYINKTGKVIGFEGRQNDYITIDWDNGDKSSLATSIWYPSRFLKIEQTLRGLIENE